MSEENGNHKELKANDQSDLNRKLAAIGWSLFLVWVGIAFLLKIDPGFGLLGIGIITLAMQAVRKYYNLKLEGFWVVIGCLFLIGGLWNIFQPKLPLVPILIIVAGLIIFFSAIRGKQRKTE